jgi:hypothetical protein
MKLAIILALAIVLPTNFALADEKPNHQILPPDVLVKNVLLPAWKASFRTEVKSWHKKGAVVLDKVTVKEDEKPAPFTEAACTADSAEKERAAPPAQDRPPCSDEL